MSGALGNLLIKLTADTGEATGDIGKAAHQIERDMQNMAVKATAAGMLIADVITKVAGSFAQAAKDAVNFGDQLNKMSQKSSLSVERLSEISFAAELSDVSIGQLGTALGMFNKVLSDSSREGSKAASVFTALGVDISRGPQVAFDQFSKAINNLPDGETKVAAMRMVFGRAGDALIPMMKGLDDASEKARQLGLVISQQMAQDSEKFNDNMKVMGVTMRALGLTAMQPMVGWLSEISENMVKAKVNGHSLQVGLLELGKTWAALWGGMAESVGAGRLAKVMESEFNRLDAMVKKLTVAPGPNGGAPAPVGMPPAPAGAGNNQPGESNPEMLACVISGGKWVDGKCVQKAAGKTNAPKKDDNLLGRQLQEDADEWVKIMAEAAAATDKYNQTLRDMEVAETATMIAGEVARAEAILQMDEILNKQTLMANGFDENGKKIGETTKKNSEWARDLGLSFTSAFEDAVLSGKKFSDVLRSLAQDIARIALRKAVTEQLAAGIGKGIEGLFKADGGPVTAGSTYIVGERGPEVFMPSVSGSIVPNHALGGGGVTVVQNISIDSRSDQASIMQAMAMSAERAKNDIMASLNRGGEFARATGRA